MSAAATSALTDAERLQLVQASIEFFGCPALRPHYTSLLRELNDERRQLRVRLERAFNGLPPVEVRP